MPFVPLLPSPSFDFGRLHTSIFNVKNIFVVLAAETFQDGAPFRPRDILLETPLVDFARELSLSKDIISLLGIGIDNDRFGSETRTKRSYVG